MAFFPASGVMFPSVLQQKASMLYVPASEGAVILSSLPTVPAVSVWIFTSVKLFSFSLIL